MPSPTIPPTTSRTILGDLNSVVNGIGALRTHGGDAHGRERGYRRIDPDARLMTLPNGPRRKCIPLHGTKSFRRIVE
jgi:hypothetical protein